MMLKQVVGYWRSVRELRKTRLTLDKVERHVKAFDARLNERAPTTKADMASLQALLQSHVVNAIAERQRQAPFDLAALTSGAPERRLVLTNGTANDLDGGFNENLKSILRTPHISQRHVMNSDLNIVTVMRPELDAYWKCVARSYHFQIPLLYLETTFFGAYSSYFDKAVSTSFRKVLGFIADDMGFYFDARVPSRLETTLNDPTRTFTDEQRSVARSMIDEIVARKMTKYNRYVPKAATDNYLGDDVVLVVDQKRNDASIRLGGADNSTFDAMLKAAVSENPGRRVLVKEHPDNRFERGGDRYRPGPDWRMLEDEVSVIEAMERASVIYTVSSQVGFEALLRGRKVVTFGLPFYAGWGLTDDRLPLPRRKAKRTIEELFHLACIEMSVYLDPTTGKITDLANTIDRLTAMRAFEGL